MWLALSLGLLVNTAAPADGALEGPLGFPGCHLPSDLEVCAESTDGALHCAFANEILSQTVDETPGFRLEVPAGRYRVYTRARSDAPNFRAYFSRAVRCGLRESCRDHRPIVAEVRASETLSGISPADWSAPLHEVEQGPIAVRTRGI